MTGQRLGAKERGDKQVSKDEAKEVRRGEESERDDEDEDSEAKGREEREREASGRKSSGGEEMRLR